MNIKQWAEMASELELAIDSFGPLTIARVDILIDLT